MNHTINKEALQSIYSEPSQQLTNQMTRTLRNLPEEKTRVLPMRHMLTAALSMLLVIAMATGSLAMTGGWRSIQQWLGLEQLETTLSEKVLYETDQVRYVLTEKTLIGNQLVLAILHQPKAPGMIVIPKTAVGRSWTLKDDIMSVAMRQMVVNINRAVAPEEKNMTLQEYLETKQLTPIWSEFFPTYFDFSLLMGWHEFLQEDGSLMTYITIGGVDGTKPLDITSYAGTISHETMETEYGYLNSNVPMINDWCERVKCTIDLPDVVNAAPQRMADPQTIEIERGSTTVTISDLKLYVLPNGWSVQYHTEVSSDIDRYSINITPQWPKDDSVAHSANSEPLESVFDWQETDNGYECDVTTLLYMSIGHVPDAADTLTMKIDLDGYVKTITLPLMPVE